MIEPSEFDNITGEFFLVDEIEVKIPISSIVSLVAPSDEDSYGYRFPPEISTLTIFFSLSSQVKTKTENPCNPALWYEEEIQGLQLRQCF